MPIIGFNFDKISVEKKKQPEGDIKIKSNVDITDVKEQEIPLGKSQNKTLRFGFDFSMSYEPKIADLTLSGHIIYMEDEKKTKEILKGWKKNKKVPPAVMQEIMNTILFKCNIKALTLSQEVNLPSHIPMPRLAPVQKKDEGQYIG